MYKIREYPSWSEIKDDIVHCDLLDIVDEVMMSNNVSLEQAIDDYIEANYDYRLVDDMDRAYEEYRDEQLIGD